MVPMSGFDFYALNFDAEGKLTDGNEFPMFEQAAAGTTTDAIFLAHGFRTSADEAKQMYSEFFKTFRGHLARPEFQEIAKRKYIVGGVFWPSQELPESVDAAGEGSTQAVGSNISLALLAREKLAHLKDAVPGKSAALDRAMALLPLLEIDPQAQDQFTDLVLTLLEDSQLDATEGLPLVQRLKGSEILPKLAVPVILPTSTNDGGGDSGGVESFGEALASILAGTNKFLNMLTWFLMKDRSGIVGAAGVAQAVRAIRMANQSITIHLVGHSLGGRLMAACAKSLAQTPILQPDSLTLLEAAFSHYGFSANNGRGTPGFFRDVITKHVVKGPLVETFSYQDTVVGLVYATASRLAGDNTQAIGDAGDEFGGIGRNGCQLTPESSVQPLKSAGTLASPYIFRTGIVNCLDGSGGLIKNHGDVTNPDVTYAFASAVASTRVGQALAYGAAT